MSNMSGVSDLVLTNLGVTFSWLDYGLFVALLLLSILIGLYFGCWSQQDSAIEYLLGNKQMSAIPIGMSLAASTVSGVALVGTPTDVYRFGLYYILIMITMLPLCFITYFVYVPVFYKLQVVSIYEYFMIRFDRRIRLFASGLYVVNTLLYLPIVIYVPALALAQATHISHHYITPLVCGVCILYTTIGGLKAVVWTDALQFVAMFGSMIALYCHGLNTVGGFDIAWQRAAEGERFDLDYDLDPTKRDTLLAAVIGTFMLGACFCTINQGFVQKMLAVPIMKDIKKALIIFYLGILVIFLFLGGIAIVMYAYYYRCDPYMSGKIAKPDQIVPFYVMEVTTAIPGLAGLFLSGVLSAALSTQSASMNSVAASIYEDFISALVPADASAKKISNILKLLVVLIGLGSMVMVYVVEHLGAIVPMNMALSSITNGPLLGLFTLGMLFPSTNSKGAFYGSIFSIAIMTFIIGGGKYHELNGNRKYHVKPLSVAECNATFPLTNSTFPTFQTFNATNAGGGDKIDGDIFVLFRITHYYYTIMGTLLTILASLLISLLTRKETDRSVNPDAISPVTHWILKKCRANKNVDVEMTEKEADTLLV